MGFHSFMVLLFSVCSCSVLLLTCAELQSSQIQVLLQLKKHLEYPKQLESWRDRWTPFCSMSPSSQVNVSCQGGFVTELSVSGDYSSSQFTDFNGYSIPNQTLSENFSVDSFVATLARLASLKVLRLVSTGLWGPLPGKIHRLFSLEHLDLSSNFLYGSIPPKIATLSSLEVLTLDDNFFNGTIPEWFSSLRNLTVLGLRNNRLEGELGDFSDLKALEEFDASFNTLTGKPPSELFSLPNITRLNLGSNLLSGSLQNRLKCGNKLRFVDISHNRFMGVLPSCLENREVKCEGNCLSSCKLKHQHQVSYCRGDDHEEKKKKKKTERIGIVVGLIVGGFVVIVVMALGLFVVCRRYWRKGISEQRLLHKTVQDSSTTGFSSEILANARFISQASKSGKEELPMCRPYSFEELKEATNNFEDSSFMGENVYGKLYRGKLENGKQVAIRRVPLSKKYSFRNFKLRLDLLAKLRHPHLVSLLGHCIDDVEPKNNGTFVFLLYEYVSNGTFHTYLSGSSGGKILNWSERLSVLLSIAKAVHFLHTGMIPGFFRNRLKTNNILLTENFMAKLSDYGLSIISQENDTPGGVQESPRSLWEMTRLEDDVYSFGFILLEALVGPSVSAKSQANLLNVMASFDSEDGWKQTVEPTVQATGCRESLCAVMSITNKCMSPESFSRPSIEDVLWNLHYASQLQANNSDQTFDSKTSRH